jgi:uncharacterized protein involved in exopolysaccharide biosynthesis
MTIRTQESARRPEREDLSLLALANMLLRQRSLILRTPLVLFVLVVAVSLVQPRTYSSRGVFMPNAAQSMQSRAAGLAAQFGFTLPGQDPGQSPDFYAELVQSREILSNLVATQYAFVGSRGPVLSRDADTIRGDLVQVLEIEEVTPARSREQAMARLHEMMDVTTNPLSGTITVQLTTEWPQLSRQIAARALELVDEFNRTRRQSQAVEERTFVEERLTEAQKTLRESEDRMERFLRDNRTFASSPQLLFENDRLQRDVAMRQQIMAGLTQAHEQARIDEVRNTPVITVVQRPEAPALPDRRRLVLKGLVAIVLGIMLGIGIALFREILMLTRAMDQTSVEEYEALKRATLRDARRPWKLLGLGRRAS